MNADLEAIRAFVARYDAACKEYDERIAAGKLDIETRILDDARHPSSSDTIPMIRALLDALATAEIELRQAQGERDTETKTRENMSDHMKSWAGYVRGLESALNFYADKRNYGSFVRDEPISFEEVQDWHKRIDTVDVDMGERARAALQGADDATP